MQMQSHPARGAWIETEYQAWRLKMNVSHPARGAWIETYDEPAADETEDVAPREGCVD